MARAFFLLIAATVIFNLSVWHGLVLVAGYLGFAQLDGSLERAATRTRLDAIEDELYDWAPDPNDPEMEVKGESTRMKLPKTDQLVVHRVADLLRRTL